MKLFLSKHMSSMYFINENNKPPSSNNTKCESRSPNIIVNVKKGRNHFILLSLKENFQFFVNSHTTLEFNYLQVMK